MQDEILDIVNEHDQVIGTINRADPASQGIAHLRIVLAFLIDRQGNVGLLKRTAHKSDPLSWALVGGCVQSGEDYDAAIVREVAEEVNLGVTDYQMSLLGYYSPQQGWVNKYGVGYYKKVYLLHVDTTHIGYNQNDFCDIVWKTPAEFIAAQKTMHFAEGLIWLLEQLQNHVK